jgi:HSP20 family protein
MAITPYRPTTDAFDRLFDVFSGPFGGTHGGSLMRAPETDVIETQDEIRVQTEMPGLSRDDIELDLENNVLTIRGEKHEERTEDEREGRYHLAERRYGVFTRSFVLPRDVDAERIQADFENGVLTVTIPKSEQAKRRRIEVRGGDGHERQQLGGGASSARSPSGGRGGSQGGEPMAAEGRGGRSESGSGSRSSGESRNR